MDLRILRSNGKKRKIRISDVTCPICFSIMIEPVTMPCQHVMCMPCFEKNGSTTSLSCPMCRLRIGAWSRRASREKTLVNTDLWEEIQNCFPKEIQKRLAGEDEDLNRESKCSVCISEPGEIRKEYEEKLKEFQKQEESLKQEQEKASLELIKKIEEEELKSINMQPVDMSLLQSFSDCDSGIELNKSSDLSNSYSNVSECLGTSPGSSKARTSSVQSADSISPELHYFKPIRAAPRTPPKQNADGKLVEPSLVCIKPRKLVYNVETFQRDNLWCDMMQDRLNSVKRDRNFRIEPILSPTSSLRSMNNGSDISASVSTSCPVENSVSAAVISGSGFSDCSLQSAKNTHLGRANKENELSQNCKNNGKRALECDHCTTCSCNGFNFKRLRHSKVQHSSKPSEASRKMCLRSFTSESKSQLDAISSPLGKEKQEMCRTWRVCGHSETSSSFTKCNSNKYASSASSTDMYFNSVDCGAPSDAASGSMLENSIMNIMEKSYLQNVKAREEQIKHDYIIACRLQETFNNEAKQYRTAPVKSEYNLRKKVRASGEEQRKELQQIIMAMKS